MNQLHAAESLRSSLCRSSSVVSRFCREQMLAGNARSPEVRFRELSKTWWDQLVSREDWRAASELGEMIAAVCPSEPFGYENWAWALHKQGKTREAYHVLAPILKKLKLPGPPSGRAAYCLACFCAALGRKEEAARWLRLAEVRALNKHAFRLHALREMDLREFWATLNGDGEGRQVLP